MNKNGSTESNTIRRRYTYSTLSGLFVAIFTGFSFLQARRNKEFRTNALELAQLGLASYRLGRMVAYDKIFEPYRAPFAKTVPDPTGAGDTTEPRGRGAREAIGELLTCPICAGTWIAAGLVYFLGLFPNAARTFLAMMSAIGLAEFLNSASEAFEWLGQAEREEAGTIELKRHRK